MSEEILPSPELPQAPPPLPLSPLERLNDFPDRLSPMLVKELRQGLRTHTFVLVFLLLQGFLALILLTTAAADTNAGDFVSGIIFSFFSIAVLVVQPLRGITAISAEIKGDTIDLMALTKLSAWRIVFGKWTSIMGQTTLLLLAIIPYLILRYFFGGMQLFSELLLLFTIFLTSGVFTALTVGLSATTVALVRVIPLIGAIILIFPIFGFAFAEFDEILELFTPTTRDHWIGLLSGYLIATFVGYFFLELAATAIAPGAENRATRKRLVAFVVILGSFVAIHLVDSDPAWIFALILTSLLSLDLLTERVDYPSIVMRPFLRYGPLGRVAARLLAPGWATGTVFQVFLLALLLLIGFLLPDGSLDEIELLESIGIILGALQLPAVILNVFNKRIQSRFSAYLLLSTLLLIIVPLFGILEGVGTDDTLVWVFCFIPHVQPFLAFEVDPADSVSLGIIWGTALGYTAINLGYGFSHFRNLTKLEKEEKERLLHAMKAPAQEATS